MTDVHRATAAEVFGVELENVTTDMRRSAKAINFGLIYGMSAFGLAKQIGVDRKQSQAYVDRYFARYPGVLNYMERTRAQAAEQGFVETIFGRRLYLPDINAKNQSLRKGAERMAINAPMQGTAADIIKKAMVAVNGWLDESGLMPGSSCRCMTNWCLKCARTRSIRSVNRSVHTRAAQRDWQCRCW